MRALAGGFYGLWKRPETSLASTTTKRALASTVDRLRAVVSELQSQERVVQLLREAIDGQVANIDELRGASQQQLQRAGQAVGDDLAVGRAAVLRLLHDWRAGLVTDEQVRWWALLLFVGAFPQDWSPYGWHFHASAQPIHIENSDDEEVNEVDFRFKDLGDFDDGGTIAADVDIMIRQLSDS